MSLDIHIADHRFNITHNLGRMAAEANIYRLLWRGEGVNVARDMIRPLSAALVNLTESPERYRPFNAPNGWGVYENLVAFVAGVLNAAILHPRAKVRHCR